MPIVTAEGQSLEALFQEGVHEHRAGRLDAAEARYRAVLARQPRQFDTLHLLGILRLQRDDPAEAEVHLRAAVALAPGVGLAHLNLAKALRGLGRPAEAIDSLSVALQREPALHAAATLLAQTLEESGRFAPALQAYELALAGDPALPLMLGRARCLLALGRGHEAVAQLRRAVAQAPDTPEPHRQLAEALLRGGELRGALVAVEQLLLLAAGDDRALALRERILAGLVPPVGADGQRARETQIHVERASALVALGRPAAAQALLEEALRIDPAHAGARGDLLALLVAGGATVNATRAFALADQLLAEQPGDPRPWFNRALQSYNLGDYAGARRGFEAALARDSRARIGRFNLGLLDLLEGNYAAGWIGHEYRWDDPAAGLHRRDFTQPQWNGDFSLAGRTLLVHAEQGLGDTLQFFRYVPALQTLAGSVILEIAAPLCALLRRWLPASIAIVERGRPLPAFDAHCPLLSLPHVLGTRAEPVPAPLPGLGAQAQRVEQWLGRLGTAPGARIGLAWSGNATHANDRQRSIPLAAFVPLVHVVAARGPLQFIALQNQIRDEDRRALAQLPQIQYAGEAIGDFEDVAALVALCDIVVSVDTAALHVAATMGRPVLGLLPHVPDWRWGLGRDSTPWYPALKLLRQGEDRKWEPVIARAGSELAAILADAPYPSSVDGNEPNGSCEAPGR